MGALRTRSRLSLYHTTVDDNNFTADESVGARFGQIRLPFWRCEPGDIADQRRWNAVDVYNRRPWLTSVVFFSRRGCDTYQLSTGLLGLDDLSCISLPRHGNSAG